MVGGSLEISASEADPFGMDVTTDGADGADGAQAEGAGGAAGPERAGPADRPAAVRTDARRRRWAAALRPTGTTRLQRWETLVDETLLLLSLLFIVVFAVPVLWPDAPSWLLRVCSVTEHGIWFVFAADLAIRTVLSGRPLIYLREHWLDVAAVALPMVRPLRPMRALLALGVLARNGRVVTRNQVVASITMIASAACVLASVAVLDAERHAENASITTMTDALWWSVCTVTTIGYGDRFPVTGTGRLVALALMAVGISMIGVITAAMASWFVEKLSAVTEAEAATAADTRTLLAEIAALRAEVRALADRPPRD